MQEDKEAAATTTFHKRFAEKEIIWLTLINKGYLPYCRNFLRSMALCSVSFTLVVFCLDQETMLALQDEPLCYCIYADFIVNKKQQSGAPLSAAMKQWGQLEYKRLVFAKLDAIQYTLQHLVQGCPVVKYVGYIDTDIWLFKDPTPIVLALANANPTIPVFAQCDEACGMCSNRTQCPNLCSGVLVLRNWSTLAPLFNYLEREISHYMGDQDYMLAKFRHYKIKTLTFDKRLIQNGAIPGLRERKLPLPLHPACCLLHFNYLIGADKQRVMALQGFWVLGVSNPALIGTAAIN